MKKKAKGKLEFINCKHPLYDMIVEHHIARLAAHANCSLEKTRESVLGLLGVGVYKVQYNSVKQESRLYIPPYWRKRLLYK